MPITLLQFRGIILKEIEASHPIPVPVEKLYSCAEKELVFDRHDLSFTISKELKTNEPNWKRNLRNALQGMKNKGELVNSSSGFWRLPTRNNRNSLDPEEAWILIMNNALKALENNESWESAKQKHNYQVEEIEKNKIIIRRKATNTTQPLYKNDVIRGINSLNVAGGSLGRRTMIYTVAKEVAIVHFHPNIRWDENFDFLYVITMEEKQLNISLENFEEAINDDISKYQNYARRIRKGQTLMRRNLLKIYNNQCCISGTGPENVLQAAHIDPHSETGCNSSTNGLLLRSDLHDLFDDGLLIIDPRTLEVKIHPKLSDSHYYQYHNRKITSRKDGLAPNFEGLVRKWERYRWE